MTDRRGTDEGARGDRSVPEPSPIGGILRRVARSRITAGVLASYANQAASAASNFLILPLYLRYLGAERYGLWVTISGIVAYFGLLNFGVVQTTANRFGSAFVARNEALSRVLASGFWSFARTIGIAALVAAAASPWIPWQVLFRGSEALRTETRPLLLLTTLAFLIELPLTLFGACLRSIGRIDRNQIVQAAQSLGRLAVAWLWLRAGGGLAGLVLWLAGINVASHLVQLSLLRREVPELSIAPSQRSPEVEREMRNPSLFFFILQLSGGVAFSTDALVISSMLGTALVAPFAVAQRITMLVLGAVTTLSTNFGPAILAAHSAGDAAGLRRSFLRTLRLSLLVGVLAASACLLLGPPLIRWWLGAANWVGFFPFSMIVGLVFLQMVLAPCDVLLVVTGSHRTYALVAAWEAALNLGLSIALVRPLGVGGVALATLVARLLGAGPYMLYRSVRMVRLPGDAARA